MIVLTVRRVAMLFRAPWWSSISIMFLAGCEKETERCDIFSTNLPVETSV